LIAFDPQSEQHEGLVVKWWADLEPDRAVTFHSSLNRLSVFLMFFTQQAKLVFDYDQRGIWFAAWVQDLCDGCVFSVWIRSDMRTKPSAWRDLRMAYDTIFQKYKRVVGYTRQPHLHAEHLKLGYEYCGRIPDIIDGNALYIYSMSREQWANRASAAAKVRAEKRAKRPKKEIVHQNGAVQQELL
jgi:hypothetical protein